jgi:hypothetical protein
LIKIDYAPTPKQILFHGSTADEILFGGAAGGGKTCAIVMDAFFRCIKFPGTNATIVRRNYRELEDTDIKEALSRYPKEVAKYNVGRHEFSLMNGSVIQFRHCEHERDKYDFQGAEIQFLYFDELTSFEESIYDYICSRLRAKIVLGIVPIVRSASNPGNIGHSWVKARFVDSGPYLSVQTLKIFSEALNETKLVHVQYIPALAMENPHITKDYIFELERKPAPLRRALLNGDWDAFEGQVFTEFVNDREHYVDRLKTHVIDPFFIPLNWPRYMSFDFGYTRPFSVGWWTVDPFDRVYRYREWYGCEKDQKGKSRPNVGLMLTPRQIAEGIVDREREETRDNIHIDRIADPSIFDQSRGDSVADQMRPSGTQKGVVFRPGDNSRLPGKLQVHERLRFDNTGRPMLYLFSTCTDWIRTVPNLPYSLKHVEDVDSDAEDHCLDETRYFLMARPIGPKAMPAAQDYKFDPYKEARM